MCSGDQKVFPLGLFLKNKLIIIHFGDFIDVEQISVQELMALIRMSHTAHDGHHHN